MIVSTFADDLKDFQAFAYSLMPEIGDNVTMIVHDNLASQFGDAAKPTPITPNAAIQTVDKIAAFFDSLSATIVKGSDSYYTAKGKIADLKAKARGSAGTQISNTLETANNNATTLVNKVPTNWLFWAVVGVGGIYLLQRLEK